MIGHRFPKWRSGAMAPRWLPCSQTTCPITRLVRVLTAKVASPSQVLMEKRAEHLAALDRAHAGHPSDPSSSGLLT